MQTREYIGILLFAIGILIVPLGWMFSPSLSALGAIVAFIGIAIFSTQRFMNKSTAEEHKKQPKRGYEVPSDIHDHSGWGRGGRSSGWMSSNSDLDGD